MSRFYITGISGTGKSTLLTELKRRGFSTIDIDTVEGLCHWRNKVSGKRGEYQPGRGRDWIEAHDYTCDAAKLREMVLAQPGRVAVSGVASNQKEYLDIFDRIFLLRCRPEVFLSRLRTRKDNDFAGELSEQEHILSWYQEWEDQMIQEGAVPIDSEAPTAAIADQVLTYLLQ